MQTSNFAAVDDSPVQDFTHDCQFCFCQFRWCV
nr:MAG TPA: hypothetical protein [Caudoviricetes sp.]